MHLSPNARFTLAALAGSLLVALSAQSPALAEARQPLDCRLVTADKAATCCPLIVDILPANRMPRICNKVLAGLPQRGTHMNAGAGGSDSSSNGGVAGDSRLVAKSLGMTFGTPQTNDKSGSTSNFTLGGGAPGI